MALWNYKGWSPMRGHKTGTVRATNSHEAMDNVLKKKLGGYGEVTVWAKKKKIETKK